MKHYAIVDEYITIIGSLTSLLDHPLEAIRQNAQNQIEKCLLEISYIIRDLNK